MPKLIKKEEVLCFEGITLSSFLNKKLLEKIKQHKLDMEPISLVFIATQKEEEKKRIHPIIIGHSSKDDVKNKLLHITAPKTKASDTFIKILEEME